MLYFLIITGSITISYIFTISAFLIGWNRIPKFQKGFISPSENYISLIIALRNEEHHIKNLIQSINNQSLDKENFEVILINDNSTDFTYENCKKLTIQLSNYNLLNLVGSNGKKNAISMGIKHAKGHLIVTTDADCSHHKNWLETILDFHLKYKPKMIIGPVLMKSGNFFERIQSLDFYSLMVSGASACGINKPIMCNGANLAYEKQLYENNPDIMNQNYPSGDDIFLMLNLKKKHASEIMFLKSTDALVYTNPEPTFTQFLNQRKRWASKSRGYRDKDIIFVAFIVLLINVFLIINLFLSLYYKYLFLFFALQFTVKSIIDFIFLSRTSSFFKEQKFVKYLVPTQIFNMIIIPYVAISGLFSTFKWKGRKYSS